MAECSGQQMNQTYDMSQSPASLQRMQAQHPSPQQQHSHMMQGSQMLSQVPQQQVMVSQQQQMSQVPQQQVMMQSSQPMQMSTWSSQGQVVQSGEEQGSRLSQGHLMGQRIQNQQHSYLPSTPPYQHQQSSQPMHRLAQPRYPTPSPSHNTTIYRSTLQRTAVTPRLMGSGQSSSAIRQALGHVPSTSSTPCLSSANTHTTATPPATSRILDKDVLDAFIKSVDPNETVEEDVSESLIQLIDEFVNNVVDQTAKVAKHRNSPKMDVKDVEFVLKKRMRLFAPPDAPHSTLEHNPYSKSPAAEAHRQRMALIAKTLQKP